MVARRNPKHTRRDQCRLCASSRLEKCLELTATPPANAYVTAGDLSQRQERYPLNVYFCHACSHAQLLDVLDSVDLFSDYVYVSGTSPANVEHFRQHAAHVTKLLGLEPGDFVIELGSNDGTLLRIFKDAGMRVLGVDPAKAIANRASENGIETLSEFFTPELAEEIRSGYGPAQLVCANNVCAHVDDLQSFIEGTRALMSPRATLVFLVSYLADVCRHTLFDTIYHEHLDYHRVAPLLSFFERLGMRLWHADTLSAQGGSLRGFVSLAESERPVSSAVDTMVQTETALGLDSIDTWNALSLRIQDAGTALNQHLENLVSQGRDIAGYGAPAKATTLMYHYGLDRRTVGCIFEDNPLKHHLYMPGTHIPIVPSQELYERRPDHVLVLAWNFADSIIAHHPAYLAGGGQFIVPLPTLRVV